MIDLRIRVEDFFPTGPDGKTVQYPWWYCNMMNHIDPRVHYDDYECCWQSPYGFVPEAGCPDHD